MSLVGWFPDSARATLKTLIDTHNVKTVIEVGAFVGLSAVFFAEECERVITIDPFNARDNSARHYLVEAGQVEAAEDQYMNFLRNTIHHPNLTGIVGESLTVATLPITADLVYIDGDHEYDAVKADIEAWSPKTRVLAGDDYSWPGVRAAVTETGEFDTDGRVWWRILR